jgi:Zn finger protein HypA/HybF involved in hydrogenase expression
MTTKHLLAGETVVIQCESCEPELAIVLSKGRSCPDCSGVVYRLQTEMKMVVDCCASILHPLN